MSSSQLRSIASYKENANKPQEIDDENVCNESNLQGSVETPTKSTAWRPYYGLPTNSRENSDFWNSFDFSNVLKI